MNGGQFNESFSNSYRNYPNIQYNHQVMKLNLFDFA